ncbi:MAG: CoA ester lyase [Burkholderiaceae bacterium]|nr:MAG: CoA ester lyase [Burkholderiaceae bacterium]
MHPSEALFDEHNEPVHLPVCDHYAGNEKLILKSLALQENFSGVLDITVDLEDGASAGEETVHAHMAAELIASDANKFNRVGLRIHAPDSPYWKQDLEVVLAKAANRLAYVTIPKVRGVADTQQVIDTLNQITASLGHKENIPVHVLIETHGGLHQVWDIAALPQVQSLSFGLMDFVSSHLGAIPSSAMRSPGQFEHPLVRRAKLEISAAALACGKVPAHNVTTEFKDSAIVVYDAQRARQEFGYLRMWSIHPDQIKPIITAFAPRAAEISEATQILLMAQQKQWGPIEHNGKLHDRASYRYYWHVLQRARRLQMPLPENAATRFFAESASQTTSPTI